MPTPALFIREAKEVFDDAGRLSDIPTRKSLEEVLGSFADLIDLVSTRRPA